MTDETKPAEILSQRALIARRMTHFGARTRAVPEDAGAWIDLGVTAGWDNAHDQAEQHLRRALALSPEDPLARFSLGLILLSVGRYAEGWPLFEARSEVRQFDLKLPIGLPFPRWNGETLAGRRILVVGEQGLGDQIQFARFLPQLAERAGAVTLLVAPPLATLFRHSFPAIDVVAPGDGATTIPMADLWTTTMSLAAHSDTTAETLPAAPYLSSPAQWEQPPSGWKTGFVAQGGAHYGNDRHRSLPSEAAARLERALPGRVINLDPGNTKVSDFAQTAAIVRELDLVVSVDTAVAHLAGAMGKPCLVLIPGVQTDWRWIHGRSDSPWYPRHLLYRNPMDGDWSEPIAALVRDAHVLAAGGALP